MNRFPQGRRRAQQDGASLIVVLVMVLLVTVLGIAGVRSLVMQERMSANSLDRTLALQSAERVLRQAEDIAMAQSAATPPNKDFTPATPLNGSYTPASGACAASPPSADMSPCTAEGLCSQPSPGCLARWLNPAFSSWKEVTSDSPATAASATAASDATLSAGLRQQYMIEYLGTNFACAPDPSASFNCRLYRITVRTNATNTDRASVILQSTFLAQTN
ncbi:MAG: PilX N-terminal domain-containing pilus assembly protein [Rhodoferax sp.]